MKLQRCFPVVLGALICAVGQSSSFADDKEKAETRVEKVDELKLTIPKAWKKVKPSSRLRTGQFSIPPAKGEKDSVDYVIYHFAGGGGGVGANVQRWIGQFEAKGRKAKVTKGKSSQGPYVLVDITGTYKKPIGPPIRRMTKSLPNARMLAVIIGVKDKRKVYYVKIAGEAKTVNANEKAIRASFGADAKSEEAVKLPGQ